MSEKLVTFYISWNLRDITHSHENEEIMDKTCNILCSYFPDKLALIMHSLHCYLQWMKNWKLSFLFRSLLSKNVVKNCCWSESTIQLYQTYVVAFFCMQFSTISCNLKHCYKTFSIFLNLMKNKNEFII